MKTHRFKTVGALPTRASEQADIQGMAINRVTRLDDQERKELAALFPHLDIDRLLIFEEGRSPATPLGSVSTMAAGCAVCLAGPFWAWFCSRRRSDEEPAASINSRPARMFA